MQPLPVAEEVQYSIVEVRLAKPLGLEATIAKKRTANIVGNAPIIAADTAHSLLPLFSRLQARKVGKKIAELIIDGPTLRIVLASNGFDHSCNPKGLTGEMIGTPNANATSENSATCRGPASRATFE